MNYSSINSPSPNMRAPLFIPTRRSKREYAVMIDAVKKIPHLSIGEKYLYQLILDSDYADKATKLCKGYVYASVATFATFCGESERTIYRWLNTLLKTNLIARQRRQNRTSKLYILDVPKDFLSTGISESQLPLATLAYKGKRENTEKLQSLERIKRFEALFSEEVTHLISLGYSVAQAIRDYIQFGAEELQRQINNLYQYLRQGKQFFSYAKWLNWAIRSRHQFIPSQQDITMETPIKKKAYVERVDSDGTTYFQEIDVPSLEETPLSSECSPPAEQPYNNPRGKTDHSTGYAPKTAISLGLIGKRHYKVISLSIPSRRYNNRSSTILETGRAQVELKRAIVERSFARLQVRHPHIITPLKHQKNVLCNRQKVRFAQCFTISHDVLPPFIRPIFLIKEVAAPTPTQLSTVSTVAMQVRNELLNVTYACCSG